MQAKTRPSPASFILLILCHTPMNWLVVQSAGAEQASTVVETAWGEGSVNASETNAAEEMRALRAAEEMRGVERNKPLQRERAARWAREADAVERIMTQEEYHTRRRQTQHASERWQDQEREQLARQLAEEQHRREMAGAGTLTGEMWMLGRKGRAGGPVRLWYKRHFLLHGGMLHYFSTRQTLLQGCRQHGCGYAAVRGRAVSTTNAQCAWFPSWRRDAAEVHTASGKSIPLLSATIRAVDLYPHAGRWLFTIRSAGSESHFACASERERSHWIMRLEANSGSAESALLLAGNFSHPQLLNAPIPPLSALPPITPPAVSPLAHSQAPPDEHTASITQETDQHRPNSPGKPPGSSPQLPISLLQTDSADANAAALANQSKLAETGAEIAEKKRRAMQRRLEFLALSKANTSANADLAPELASDICTAAIASVHSSDCTVESDVLRVQGNFDGSPKGSVAVKLQSAISNQGQPEDRGGSHWPPDDSPLHQRFMSSECPPNNTDDELVSESLTLYGMSEPGLGGNTNKEGVGSSKGEQTGQKLNANSRESVTNLIVSESGVAQGSEQMLTQNLAQDSPMNGSDEKLVTASTLRPETVCLVSMHRPNRPLPVPPAAVELHQICSLNRDSSQPNILSPMPSSSCSSPATTSGWKRVKLEPSQSPADHSLEQQWEMTKVASASFSARDDDAHAQNVTEPDDDAGSLYLSSKGPEGISDMPSRIRPFIAPPAGASPVSPRGIHISTAASAWTEQSFALSGVVSAEEKDVTVSAFASASAECLERECEPEMQIVPDMDNVHAYRTTISADGAEGSNFGSNWLQSDSRAILAAKMTSTEKDKLEGGRTRGGKDQDGGRAGLLSGFAQELSDSVSTGLDSLGCDTRGKVDNTRSWEVAVTECEAPFVLATKARSFPLGLEGVSRASLLSEANDDSADRSFQIRLDTSQRQADSHSEYHPQRRPKLLPTPRHMTGPPELASPPSSSLKAKSEDSAHPTITINTHTNRVDTPEELGVHVWSHPSSQDVGGNLVPDLDESFKRVLGISPGAVGGGFVMGKEMERTNTQTTPPISGGNKDGAVAHRGQWVRGVRTSAGPKTPPEAARSAQHFPRPRVRS